MRSRPGIFITIVAAITIAVSGLGFVVVKQSQKAEPRVKQETARYEQQKAATQNSPVTTDSSNQSTLPQQPAQPQPTATDNQQNTSVQPVSTVQVFFTKNPDSGDSDQVFPVSRNVDQGQDAGVVAINALIAGPTNDEVNQGYVGGLELTGSSNCDGKDYTLTITNGTATLRLCRKLVGSETLSDNQTAAQIRATLLSLPGASQASILNRAGNCMFANLGDSVCQQ